MARMAPSCGDRATNAACTEGRLMISEIINLPSVQAAFVALSPQDGAIRAMVGGFDFYRGNFNRVTQAWRQPGSNIKPFIYAASLERGLTPGTQISDQPFELTA